MRMWMHHVLTLLLLLLSFLLICSLGDVSERGFQVDPAFETAVRLALQQSGCTCKQDLLHRFPEVSKWPSMSWTRESVLEKYGKERIQRWGREDHLGFFVYVGNRAGGSEQQPWTDSLPFSKYIGKEFKFPYYEKALLTEEKGRTDIVKRMVAQRDVAQISTSDLKEKESMQYAYLTAGPNATGLPFHMHERSYYTQIVGKKLWFFHQPYNLPVGWKVVQPHVFLTKILPEMGSRIHCCIADAGESITIPDFWWHATLSIGESIGFGFEKKALHPEMLQKTLTSNSKAGLETPEYMLSMASVMYSKQGDENKAREMSGAAYNQHRLNPSQVRQYVARLLVNEKTASERTEEAEHVLAEFERECRKLHKKKWIDAREMSVLISMIGFIRLRRWDSKMSTAGKLGSYIDSMMHWAVKLDPQNWEALFGVAQVGLKGLSNSNGQVSWADQQKQVEMSMRALQKLSTRNPPMQAAKDLHTQLCNTLKGMPDFKNLVEYGCRGVTITDELERFEASLGGPANAPENEEKQKKKSKKKKKARQKVKERTDEKWEL
eukprot:gnl/MRDRNA2_/MRDRNA2_27605_c0_seq2.p1 gnl/MRDRNA2_/MRDRNA2_27605_c0~~gnl/MRDRNA2_/MRDRNA2_27605_c0_seq2.p1  ORF type:complete len:549 (-),score=109.27 gnl/MRDRNA2_/MRDRNA2_27605_c0_seq2:423-2069(-)